LANKIESWGSWQIKGMKMLEKHRTGDGKRRRFPFFYTSLALSEIGPEIAPSELEYITCLWKNSSGGNPGKSTNFIKAVTVLTKLFPECFRIRRGRIHVQSDCLTPHHYDINFSHVKFSFSPCL
jgi:hypothetical protein